MEAELRAMLTMSVTITPAAAPNAYGAAVGGTPYAAPTRIRWKRQEVATQAGEAAVADGHLWLDSDAVVPTVRAKLALPGGAVANVVAVEPVNDEAGLHHTKIYFGVPANG
jgi:hypothetical protein